MTCRLRANELLDTNQNQKLSQYEEKIQMKNLFNKFSIPTTKVHIKSDVFNFFQIGCILFNDCSTTSLKMKGIHLHCMYEED